MVDDLDRVARTDLLAAMYDTAAAGRRYKDPADRTFIASDIDHLHHVRIVFVAALRQFDALLDDGALFIDTATHRRFRPRRNLLGNIYVNIIIAVFVFIADHRFQHIIFQLLYRCIKNSFVSHNSLPTFSIFRT